MKKAWKRSESRVSAGRNLVARDAQQAWLLGILTRRAGELVTYDELRAAGIELPASRVAELELAGVEFDRFSGTAPDGRAVRGVRFPSSTKEVAGVLAAGGSGVNVADRPARSRHGSSAPESASRGRGATGWGAVRIYRGLLPSGLATRWSALAGRGGEPRFAANGTRDSRVRLIAPLALLIGAAVTAALVLSVIKSGGVHPGAVARENPRAAGSARASVSRTHVHSALGHPMAHSAHTSAPPLTSQVVASSAGQQNAPQPATANPGLTAQTSSPPAANSTPPTASSAAPVADASAGQSQPQGAVQAFYEAAAQHRYAAAWALADANMREEVGGYAAFANQMSSVREISFQGVDVLQHAPTWATIAVRTTSVQTTRTQQCWGTVRTVEQSGAWLLDAISIHCS